FLKLIDKRKQHWPIAYLIHKKEFYGLSFYVDQNTLIPRPETEKLVNQTLKYIQKLATNHQLPITILEAGTGSGCIAISIAKNTKIPVKIIASDICKKALLVAQKNANYHKVQIQFIQSDLLENVKKSHFANPPAGEAGATRDQRPDIIVANLPYITPRVYAKLEPEITNFEPKKALLAKTRNYYYSQLKEQLKQRNWDSFLIFE
ncbi:N5-glutamine methyltransferase family protein, partial [Patescibacteria group bacterium]